MKVNPSKNESMTKKIAITIKGESTWISYIPPYNKYRMCVIYNNIMKQYAFNSLLFEDLSSESMYNHSFHRCLL